MTKKFVKKSELELDPMSVSVSGISPCPGDIINWISKNQPDKNFRLILEVEEEDGVGQWYWHIHHETLAEPLTEPLQNRIDYIKANKTNTEVRLKWLTPVSKLPEGLNEMWNIVGKVQNPVSSITIISPELLKQHKIDHPDCPFVFGKGLFP